MNDPISVQLTFSRRQLRAGLATTLVLATAYGVQSESLRLTSYYPSPGGVYRKLVTTMETILAQDGGRVVVGTNQTGEKLNVGAASLVVADGRVGIGAPPGTAWKLDVKGAVTVNGHRIDSVARPTDRGDAANKEYVDQSVEDLRSELYSIRDTLRQEIAMIVKTPENPATPSGKWYQANQQACPAFCAGLGLANVASPDGHWCVSGENNASGARETIVWTYGLWKHYRNETGDAQSFGGNCYQSSQKRDGDKTDRTVGCFCE
ncbi:MAG: hypothetical protein HY554_00445 [Elusimicrobia bacterium]|nr:hypothetical protein [Elusimicrobiota bacterium]